MAVFTKSKWIWNREKSLGDEYCEFYKEFFFDDGKAFLNISCDSDYTLFVNGKFFESNQFFSFEHYKVYDRLELTDLLNKGVNSIAVIVWHIGDCKGIQRYRPAEAGLIFEIEDQNGKTLAFSDKSTPSRLSNTFKNGYKKRISSQIGYSFLYDATKEDAFPKSLCNGFTDSYIVDKKCSFFIRPAKKLCLGEKSEMKIIKISPNKTKFLIDLGRETVGPALLEFFSETEQKITVSYSECLENGKIRRFILKQDYSYEYISKKGQNSFANYMLRLACRYIEVSCEKPIELKYCGIIPQYYPVKAKDVACRNKSDKEIYDVCLRTLYLCMLEHYVDCPWREQCLYVFDSRNQMLCGYYAFEDCNFEYAKANLKLISQDIREDDLLSICFPCAADLTIPSFSLYYIVAVKEYLEYSGDTDFVTEIFPKLCSIISVFISNIKNGVLCKFEDKQHWNFYDWSDHLAGFCGLRDDPVPDLMINLIMIKALNSFRYICKKTDYPYRYGDVTETLKQRIAEIFYRENEGAFAVTADGNEFTDLGNAFAVITDVVTGNAADNICERLMTGKWSECSLSMKAFVYDALIKNNREKYADVILEDIRKNYRYMLDNGATSVWETLKGYEDQLGSGSLCHGWSAIPIYYFHKLGVIY